MVEFPFEEYQWVTCKYTESWHGIILDSNDRYYKILYLFIYGEQVTEKTVRLHVKEHVNCLPKPLMAYINPDWI